MCLCGKAFTLIELVVAIGLLSIVLVFSGSIFKASIGSYRTASAQAEIMRKLRVITEQLNADFKGIRKDAPVFIWFQQDAADPNQRFDQIMFFAVGDFQSTRLYSSTTPKVPASTGSPIVSNTARIYYGQAQSPAHVLARRQHLFVANPESPPFLIQPFPLVVAGGLLSITPALESAFEHDTNSLSQWRAALLNGTNNSTIITACFGSSPDFSDHRPYIDFSDAATLHMLMTEGVGSFSVQWSYTYTYAGQTFVYWWPSVDDFSRMSTSPFGIYFNAAAPSAPVDSYWFPYSEARYLSGATPDAVYPRALKFTFTLYDSRGVFRGGQTFTHIVYLGD